MNSEEAKEEDEDSIYTDIWELICNLRFKNISKLQIWLLVGSSMFTAAAYEKFGTTALRGSWAFIPLTIHAAIILSMPLFYAIGRHLDYTARPSCGDPSNKTLGIIATTILIAIYGIWFFVP